MLSQCFSVICFRKNSRRVSETAMTIATNIASACQAIVIGPIVKMLGSIPMVKWNTLYLLQFESPRQLCHSIVPRDAANAVITPKFEYSTLRRLWASVRARIDRHSFGLGHG